VREPDDTIKARITAAWPAVRVRKDTETGRWHAAVPVAASGTVGVSRRSLAALEDAVHDVLNGAERAEREQRRAAAGRRTV